jgi:hypothetical protein
VVLERRLMPADSLERRGVMAVRCEAAWLSVLLV